MSIYLVIAHNRYDATCSDSGVVDADTPLNALAKYIGIDDEEEMNELFENGIDQAEERLYVIQGEELDYLVREI